MLKNLKGSPLSVFRHCETLARQGLALASPGAPLGPIFLVCNFFKKKFEKFSIFDFCKRILDTWKSFCYFWALDMAPTWAGPGLFKERCIYREQWWIVQFLETYPNNFSSFLHTSRYSQMTRMGENCFSEFWFFVALFLAYRAKIGLFCVFFAWQANSLRWVVTSDTGVGYGFVGGQSSLLMMFFNFRSHHPPRRKCPFYHFRSQFSTFMDEVRAFSRCEGVGWARQQLYTKSRFRQSPFRNIIIWVPTYHPFTGNRGHASFFCVAKVTCAHLANSEAPEQRGTLVLSKHLSRTLPDVTTGNFTGNDIIGPEMVKKWLFQSKIDTFVAIFRQNLRSWNACCSWKDRCSTRIQSALRRTSRSW